MHKSGHWGVSLFLSSPIVSVLLVFELYFLAAVFTMIVLSFSSLPDVDMDLKNYSSLGIRTVPLRLYPYVIFSRIALALHNTVGNLLFERVTPQSQRGFTISHRGLTHTGWWAMTLGGVTGTISALVLAGIHIGLEPQVVADIYEMVLQAPPSTVLLVTSAAGFFGIVFHIIGDMFTPTGIHFWTLKTNYGFSFNQFLAKNEVANRSAPAIGVLGFCYSLFFGVSFGELPHKYLLGGFAVLFLVGVPVWLVFVRTRLGQWTYTVYDFLK